MSQVSNFGWVCCERVFGWSIFRGSLFLKFAFSVGLLMLIWAVAALLHCVAAMPMLLVPPVNSGPFLNADLQTWLPSLMSGMAHCPGLSWLSWDMILTQVIISSFHPDPGLLIFFAFFLTAGNLFGDHWKVTSAWLPSLDPLPGWALWDFALCSWGH